MTRSLSTLNLQLTPESSKYRSTDFIAPGPGKLQLVFTPETGKPEVLNVYDFEGPGVAMAMYNTDEVRCLPYRLEGCSEYVFPSQ